MVHSLEDGSLPQASKTSQDVKSRDTHNRKDDQIKKKILRSEWFWSFPIKSKFLCKYGPRSIYCLMVGLPFLFFLIRVTLQNLGLGTTAENQSTHRINHCGEYAKRSFANVKWKVSMDGRFMHLTVWLGWEKFRRFVKILKVFWQFFGCLI